jgi:CIC family chloride channel protein
MGAVFTSAARAPLTSLASVVEMSGDFSLTLPVMLAVAIATTVSRALSYGTIYTTKLLRRGTDIDQAAPWRALQDLKITDVMRPFRPALPVPPGQAAANGDGTAPSAQGDSPVGNGSAPEPDPIPGLVTRRHDLQALFASESFSQALRQLEVYGRDGLPVLSADGHRVEGWVTGASVLRALARQITGSQADTIQAQAAADWEHHDAQAVTGHPTAPLPGYQVIEITITGDSPAVGRKLGDLAWPSASTLVSVLQGRHLRPPDRQITLSAGDRVSLLIPSPQDSHPAHPDGSSRGRTASHEASSGSGGTQ